MTCEVHLCTDLAGTSAAKRRRDRRLRSWLRHERKEALHHSCGGEPSGPNEAPRGQKTATAGVAAGASV